jgi:hypothetical protein
MRARAVRREPGHVAIEFTLAVGLLLFPVVVLVATLPAWSGRQHAATVAAREAASVAAAAYPGDGRADALEAVEETLANYGIPPEAVETTFTRDEVRRGGIVSVRVTIAMPAVVVPGIGTVSGFRCSATQSRRVDDYRSA